MGRIVVDAQDRYIYALERPRSQRCWYFAWFFFEEVLEALFGSEENLPNSVVGVHSAAASLSS